MPMNYATARGVALLLYDEPLAKVFELKRVTDDCYRIRFSDRRDGRIHTVLEVAQLVTWIDSILAGRVLQPDYGVCEVCDCLHGERDSCGELRSLCRSCLLELLENGIGGEQA
ncbi:MAG: hypothetical protein M3346_02865 [Actinomycetota bacterium]|nr:hypothetical protein [Actinomycetota bacterium]